LSPVRPLRDEGKDGSPGAQQESDKLKTAHVA